MVLELLSQVYQSFILGLLTPLGAVCVLPLYPGFLAYLAKESSKGNRPDRKTFALFGAVVASGVVAFMLILGLLFTTLLQQSLTNVIAVVSPLAFGILAIISVAMILDVEFGRFLPKVKTPTSDRPLANAFFYGFFFGAIVIPCNPGFIAVFLARATLINNFLQGMLNFLFFGLGIGFPLVAFSLLSTRKSKEVINFLSEHQRQINLGAGIIMLIISVYYLVVIFRVLG